MALGGVDTGIMKPSEVANANPTAIGMGLKPSDSAVLMDIGDIRLVAAVWDVSSDNSSPTTQKRDTNSNSDG